MSTLPGFNEPYPSRDAIVKPNRHPTDILTRWEEQSLLQRVNQSPYRVQPAEVLTNVAASASGTLGGDQTAGLYRVTFYLECVAADPVSQSLTLVIGWNHNTKALTRSLAVLTGAPLAIDSTTGGVAGIDIDAGTPISYTLTYASNTPGLGKFDVTMSAELLQAIA